MTLPDLATISVDEAHAESGVSFGAVTFSKPGTYTFIITESDTGSGLGKGEHTGAITLKVEAEDNGNGTLKLTVTGAEGTTLPDGSNLGSTGTAVTSTIHFVNTYDESGSFGLSLSKLLVGRPWKADEEFTFTIEPNEATKSAIGKALTIPTDWAKDGDSNYTVTVGGAGDTVSAGADGWTTKTHSLGDLTVGKLGDEEESATYTFTVTEDTSEFGGDLYCRQPSIRLTVTATRNIGTGTHSFVATYAYLENGGPGPELTNDPLTLPFTNYAAAVADPSETGSSLTVGKTLTGRDWQPGESYEVQVELTSGNAAEVKYADGADEYKLWNTALTHTLRSESGGPADPGDWTLDFRFFAEGIYEFTVKELPKTDGLPNVTCDSTVYTVTFTVTRDGDRLVVTRNVASSRGGAASADGSIVFTNVYTPTPATWTPSVTKDLEGREWAANDRFTFTLTLDKADPGDGVTMNGATEITVKESSPKHKESFGQVQFTKAGDYTFTITETDPEHGITVEKGYAYTIHVSVTDNPDTTGKLSIALTNGGKDPIEGTPTDQNTSTSTEFVNNYSQKPGKFALELRKTLEGRAWKDDESFAFTITPEKDYGDAIAFPAEWAPSGGACTVTVEQPESGSTNTASGEFTVNKAGTYVFTIKETQAPGADTYCPEPEITLTVNAVPVTKDGVPTGEMQVITTYAASDDGSSLGGSADGTATTVAFTNYAYAEDDLDLRKDLKGRDWGASEEFHAEVQLTEADLGDVELTDGPVVYIPTGEHLSKGGAVTVPLTETRTKARFRFLAVGTYTFEVTEVHGRLSGVSYDPSVYTVTVNVTADEDGVLTAAAPTIMKNSVRETEIVFENDYDPEPITGGLTVRKNVLSNTSDTTAFHFTVTLDDHTVNGDRSGMHFVNGVAEFDLYHGLSVTAVGLHAGTHYTVTEETVSGYTTRSTGAEGTIPGDGVAEAHFTNTAEGFDPSTVEDKGGLVISTYVTGIGKQDKQWHFEVTLESVTRAAETGPYTCIYFKDGSPSPVTGTVTFTNGTITNVNVPGIENDDKIMLHHREHLVIYGLTPEETYSVHEVEAGLGGYTTKTLHVTGTIPHHDIASAVIVNDLEPEDIPAGSLTVYKTVAGQGADRTKAWPFTLTLRDGAGQLVNGTFNGVTFVNGEHTFQVAHGGHMTFTGLPEGYHYEVSEGAHDGYTVSPTSASGTIQANVNATASFVNTIISTTPPDPGHGFLTVTKTVTGNAGDHTRKFDFTVQLSDSGFSQTFGDIVFTGGMATFKLADGESVTFELPAGTYYTVAETPAEGYTTTSTDSSGTVPAGSTAVASFVNNRTIATGNLTVSKTVTGREGDREREWNFQVVLVDRNYTGRFGTMEFNNGVATFTLRHGESITATDLPAEIAYYVRETDANTGNYTTTAQGDSGLIPAGDTVLASFVNAWHAPAPPARRVGSLTVSKIVTGEGGDTDREWRFRAELDQKLTGIYGGMVFVDGAAEFTLKHGQSVTADNLPEGVSYAVSELDADQEGYVTDAVGAEGTIANGGTAQAVFTNSKTDEPPVEPTDPPVEPTDDPSAGPTDNPPAGPTDNPPVDPPDGPHIDPSDDTPKTGDDSHLGFWFSLMILGLVGLIAVAVLDPEKRRHKRNGDKRTKQ